MHMTAICSTNVCRVDVIGPQAPLQVLLQSRAKAIGPCASRGARLAGRGTLLTDHPQECTPRGQPCKEEGRGAGGMFMKPTWLGQQAFPAGQRKGRLSPDLEDDHGLNGEKEGKRSHKLQDGFTV